MATTTKSYPYLPNDPVIKNVKRRMVRRRKGGLRAWNAKPILDAKQSFMLDVTKRDCERGADGDPGHCAAAVAALRQFPHAKNVWVGRRTTIVELVDHCIRFKTPSALRDQEVRYDAGARRFDPGSYMLLPVSRSEIRRRGKEHGPNKSVRASHKSKGKRTMRELGRPSIRHATDKSTRNKGSR